MFIQKEKDKRWSNAGLEILKILEKTNIFLEICDNSGGLMSPLALDEKLSESCKNKATN